ncbi:uncharacterized protein LOC6043078 [Culex quinquefasciatus]|uniref:uncharacterized protein LOC6043078 n=1 Tax=Culex quinquefasciatus TaxID=7176 RepID=UPI0018E3C781|nr:uncharacterized protein LOC6043078 [Culex quinquefasciatus]
MSKLSFRARALDPSKPMPIYLAEELPDLPEYSAINRAVPQMPSGMEKEEESEHHLQRAICTGLIIPTPEVFEATDSEFYERYYSQDYKMPKQLIHMQPLNLEQDVPDYDMDSADEQWITTQGKRLDLDPLKFETMMDRLEKSSGQTVVTLNEAKALLKQDDELSIAVYDYWLNKRLKMQHPLILSVKTESRGNTTPNNPYLAFRRRTEKMQTRKNRKNDESSYEKMLKLRRDLSRAVTLLEMIKRREKIKREQLHLSIEVYEKRYQAQDFAGQMLAEFASNATKASRPAFAPIYSNQYSSHHGAMAGGQGVASGSGAGVYGGSGSSSQYHGGGSSRDKRDGDSHSSSRKEKRQYKKRKHKIQKDRGGTSTSGSATVGAGSSVGRDGSALAGASDRYHYQYHPAGGSAGGQPLIGGRGTVDPSAIAAGAGLHGSGTAGDPALSSDEEELANLQGATAPEEEYAYAFRRSKFSQYHRPITKGFGNWPWVSKEENGAADPRYRFTLASLRHPRPRCIGFARRRFGRGGRVIIDRASTTLDDLWSRLDYKIIESETSCSVNAEPEEEESVVVSTTMVPPVATTTDRKRPDPSPVPMGGGAKRRRLVIKEETDLDELFLAGVGLVRKRSPSGSFEEEQEEQIVEDRVQVKQEKCGGGDERTSTPAAVEATVISSLSGGVNNSENNVIKSEVDAMAVEVKQEVLEDYEHMIDNVNNSYRNRISGSGGSGNGINSSSSGIVNSKNNFIQSFSNSISSNSRGLASRSVQHAAAAAGTTGASSSGSLQSSSSSSRGRQIAEELGLPLDSQAIASVYSDLLEEIQSSWLHFRPKTPEPLPLEDDLLLADDPLFATDANRISLELQALGEEGLPEEVFTRSSETVFRTRQFALDALVEPHPLGQLATVARTTKDGDELGIKLETCSNSDNNLSGDSLNDLNLSLNESGEDEKMLDKILQECQIDDMKSLNQTSNFWNGILEDGILNQLEVPEEAGGGAGGGAGTGVDVKEELASPPPPVDGAPIGVLSTVNKLGYCSELVGYDRPATVERYKNKRRKILRRCNIQVGSSCFTVRSPPPEEIVRKLSDSAAAPDLDTPVLDGTTTTGEKPDPTSEPAPQPAEVKVEDESDSVSATIPSDQIKIEPPDELLAACSPSTPASTNTTPLIHSHSAPHLQTNTSVMAPFHHSLSAPQIKLEPALNHTTTLQPSSSTSFLIASPSTVQVQVQQAAQNPLIQTAQTTIPIVQQQPSQQQQITISSASSSGTSTPTGSYIVQHTTPIVLSQQQMQQIATSGGNIVTVSGNQVITAKQHQQLQQQQIQLQNAAAGVNAGETYFSLSPIKKQINGPNDKVTAGGAVTVAGAVVGATTSGTANATSTGVDGSPKATPVGAANLFRFAASKQNVIGPRFLINQRIPAGTATGAGTTAIGIAGSPTTTKQQQDLNKKQLEMITKALDIRAQKMIVKQQQQGQQQQQQQQQLTQQLVIHQNSLQQPITIQSSGGGQSVVQGGGGQGTTQKQYILTSSPQLIGSPHGKIAINSIGTAGGDADKNRIVYANIKNSRGQFLAHINHQKVVNIIQPIQQQQQQQQQQAQQQKLMNNVVGQQQTTQQQLLGAVSAASATTTIVNSKGGGMRIPTVSIRAAQQQPGSSAAPDSTTTATMANSASIKFIQVTGPAVSSAAAAADNGAVTTTTATTTALQGSAVPTSSSAAVATTTAGAAAPPTTINITNR